MLGITDYAWRLIPGNPILLRVVEGGGKKKRDLAIRCIYLGLLILLVVFALLTSSNTISGTSLSDLAKVSSQIFQEMSYLQLGLVALLAPIFTAGAITQEKDSQTYDILLSTPLTNGQIVLGSMLSRLFFVVALLISGIPIFSITQVFGGVAISSIIYSCMIAAVTALVTGAVATAIATLKVGTRRTIFSFYMFIVLYLVGTLLLDRLPAMHPIATNGKHIGTSWMTGINPFLSLRTLFSEQAYLVPDLVSLPPALRSWPFGWYFTSPASFYVTATILISLILVAPSIVFLRLVAQSTLTPKTWIATKLHLSKGDRTKKPRPVWMNPVAWREAKTKASAARATMMRYGFTTLGILGAIFLLAGYAVEEAAPQYVKPSDYNATEATITIIQGERATTYKVPYNASVTINGVEHDLTRMHSRMMVKDYTVNHNYITSLSLVDMPRRLNANDVRQLLLGLVIIEFAVILLVVTNAAASTVTREKEDGTLDLLLTTPITSRYYIWGKLHGLVAFVLPLIAVPVASVGLFVVYDIFTTLTGSNTSDKWVVLPEALLIMPVTLIIVAAFAAMVGMHMSLRCRTTVRAVMASVAIVVGVCGALSWCGYGALNDFGAASEVSVAMSSFSPFTVMTVLIDPWKQGGRAFTDLNAIGDARMLLLFFSLASTAAYAVVVWQMYRGMVKNFDMTIRKQSR